MVDYNSPPPGDPPPKHHERNLGSSAIKVRAKRPLRIEEADLRLEKHDTAHMTPEEMRRYGSLVEIIN